MNVSTVSEPVSLSAPRGADAGLTPKQLAEKYGLTVSGRRPGLFAYSKQLWARRHFIWAFATARLVAQYTDAKLGQVWQVVTPLLNCAVFYLVFGEILKNKDDNPYYVAWLCIGVFIFQFTQNAVQSGTRAISDNLGLIRALHFPRASLPIAFTVIQLQQLLISMVVLFAVVLMNGIEPGRTWVLVIPALLLQSMFNTGVALIFSRVGAKTSDISQLIPFAMRAWLFLSGVMYSISDKIKDWPPFWQKVMELNPASVYIDLVRHALAPIIYNKHEKVFLEFPPHQWKYAIAWGVGMLVIGYVFFWKAEEEYGRG
ncbi:ABC transporter permease [Kitasatospora purpeofusca]|uniref:ABC transporter permease n=1 Tax=Kitasatospora purpeofusca TaxID=67352 RepID=UPI00224EBEAA|nr:ABC transporter permease [Kitasatospora purpeofusca]MCX4756569.1 ABC transporter permease [Kitasatospora purpeofusca]WSR35630.1 ABC transporter permease [Kitasatospora purpeofusca]WSR43937.1 ABC transporter permease [Kitasatospora purpeofusca]